MSMRIMAKPWPLARLYGSTDHVLLKIRSSWRRAIGGLHCSFSLRVERLPPTASPSFLVNIFKRDFHVYSKRLFVADGEENRGSKKGGGRTVVTTKQFKLVPRISYACCQY